MNGKENPLELLVMCAVMMLLSILGIVGGFSRDLFGNMDGILILGICLMMALISILLFLDSPGSKAGSAKSPTAQMQATRLHRQSK